MDSKKGGEIILEPKVIHLRKKKDMKIIILIFFPHEALLIFPLHF